MIRVITDLDYHAHDSDEDRAFWDVLKAANPAYCLAAVSTPPVSRGLADEFEKFSDMFTDNEIARIFSVPPHFCFSWEAHEAYHILRASRNLKPRKYRALLRRTC